MNQDFFDTRTHFITLRLAVRRSDLLLRAIDDLRRAMRKTIAAHPLRIEAIAVLPAVLHMIWTLPRGDPDLRGRLRMLKTSFSPALPPSPANDTCPTNDCDKDLWQQGHQTHIIQDEADFVRHRNFIYLSPVHANLCAHPGAWRHSSLHRDMYAGTMQPPVAGLHRAAANSGRDRHPTPGQGDFSR